MNWSSSVLTTLSTDTEPSIIVTFPDAKYIFNTSENTTRSFLQSGRHWRKTKALFFTQARVEKTSGLPGLVMTFADATLSDLQLYGPQGIKHILASMRLFTFRDSIKIQPSEISITAPPSPTPTPCYSDANLKVYAIPVTPSPISLPTSEPEPETAPSTDKFALYLEGLKKRKRESSPEPPQKRLNKGTEKDGRGPISQALLAEFNKENFSPDTLTGDLADEYLDIVVRAMFPATNINVPEKGKKGKKPQLGQPQEEEVKPSDNADPDDYRRNRAAPPLGFRTQLPTPSLKPAADDNIPTLSYLLVGPQYRGKFNAERAKELGVPQGRLRSVLARGEAITFEVKEGNEIIQRTVQPDEVMAKAEPPAAVLILDVPSVAYIPTLISSFKNSEFYGKFWSEDPITLEAEDREYNTRLVYHLCGQGVLEDEKYKEFMRGFSSITEHVISSREHCPDPVTFTNAAYNQLRLNKLDEKVFHIPKFSLTPKKQLSEVENLPSKLHLMTSSLNTNLRPWAAPSPEQDVVQRDRFHPIITGAEKLVHSPALEDSIQQAKKHVAQILANNADAPPVVGADVGVIPLGTGGSLPSKYRNVLSTLIRIPNWGNILLDAGEGTWGQLARNYGLDGTDYTAWQALRDLKCIFISHMHADHHVGLAHLLAKRQQLNPPPSDPLYIVSIRGVHLYLRELSAVQNLGLDSPSENGVIPILSESIHYAARGKYSGQGIWSIGGNEPWLDFQTSVNNAKKMREALGLEWFKTVDVYHRCRCYGVVFKHKDGWSVAFSADTAPSDNLRRNGMDVTVLIHEATMADSEIETAKKKAHSTIGQAISEGKQMRAKNIFLTHFSARYPKMPHYLTSRVPTPEAYDTHNVVVPAFDHANLTIGDMWKMQFYLSSINRNFEDTKDQDEEDGADVALVSNVSRG
ncbi:hypothetical protein CPC08DRAFT_143698 [Agrocybe pediades]|nr:hypothetical protein CPC08DRAFT_143698 [Agrocybe pediades]